MIQPNIKGLVLDVGCGADPKGDVNVDAFPKNREQCAEPWNPKQTKNFVLADAQHLPFRDKAFSRVVCNRMFEHVHNPLETAREMARVATQRVDLKVPSQYSLDWYEKTHLYSWSPSTLRNLLSLAFKSVYVSYSTRINLLSTSRIARYIPVINVFLSKLWIRPELHAVCYT